MKSIKEWLEELPEPYRTQALENTSADKLTTGEHSLSAAIHWSFDWRYTPQGYQYWNRVYTEAFDNSIVMAPAPETPARKPFDLEAAKAGKPAVFGNGTPVYRFLAFDFKASGYPILASYLDENKQELLVSLTEKGEYNLHGSCDGSQMDVFMAVEKVTKWVNVYRRPYSKNFESGECLYDTEADAIATKKNTGTTLFHVGVFPIEITL